jgi:epoxyqueuosine reductase
VLHDRLQEWAATRGYRLAAANVAVLQVVRKKLEDRRASGLIDGAFFAENLAKFRDPDGSTVRGTKWVVLIAVPSPVSVLSLDVGGRPLEALIPPTYVRYDATFQDVLGDLKKTALGGKARIEVLKAPLKSLAAHMGLVRYGRNNITYAEGLGSGFQLCGYLVGTKERLAERKDGGRGGIEAGLERCASCTACIKACPTGAIREERFLISAERCFTLHSESRRPIPPWARPPEALCLIGCLACQRICPENKGLLRTVRADFDLTSKETAAFLRAGRMMSTGVSSAKPFGRNRPLWSALKKFDGLGLAKDFEVMGRNLDYFMKNRTRGS